MGGRIVGEKRGGVYHSHQHDALGNTIALINDSATLTNTYTYWPYGELRTSTGSTVNLTSPQIRSRIHPLGFPPFCILVFRQLRGPAPH